MLTKTDKKKKKNLTTQNFTIILAERPALKKKQKAFEMMNLKLIFVYRFILFPVSGFQG